MVVFTVACLSCAREADWCTFSSPEGGFSVEAPGVLEKKVAMMETMIGPVSFTAYVLEEDRILYMAGYCDWPDSLVERKAAGDLLTFAIEGAINNLKGKVTRNTEIAMGTSPGRELIVDLVTMNQEHTIRVYLVGNRMYQLSVVIPKRDEFKQHRSRFLGSFRLAP